MKNSEEENRREVLIAAKVEVLPEGIEPNVPFSGKAILEVRKVTGLVRFALGEWDKGLNRPVVKRDFTPGHIDRFIKAYPLEALATKASAKKEKEDENEKKLAEALAEIEKLKAEKAAKDAKETKETKETKGSK